MYTIGQLARRAHVKTDSVRFYERQRLLSPVRKTSSGYRLYAEDAVRRIAFVKHAQRCGFSLAEIRDLLEMRDGVPRPASEVHRFLHEKRTQVEVTITALQAMSKYLSELARAHPLNGSPSNPAGLESAQSELRHELHADL